VNHVLDGGQIPTGRAILVFSDHSKALAVSAAAFAAKGIIPSSITVCSERYQFKCAQ